MASDRAPRSGARALARFLAPLEPFSRLDAKARQELASQARSETYRAKEVIFLEGWKADSAWILYTGRIDIVASTKAGRRRTLESIVPGELFGTLCRLFRKEAGYPCSAEAAVDSLVLRFPIEVFERTVRGQLEAVESMCVLCAKRMAQIKELPRLSMEKPAVKVAYTLTRMRQIYGDEIPLREREIAQLAGTATETAYRVLASFRKKGLIDTSTKRILVLKADALEALGRGP